MTGQRLSFERHSAALASHGRVRREVQVRGGDLLIGESGADNFNAGGGNDSNFARDGVAEAITCGAGTDSALVDAIDKLRRGPDVS